MTTVMSGQDLIDAGMSQGKWFRPALDAANAVLSNGGSMADAMEAAKAFEPWPTLAVAFTFATLSFSKAFSARVFE